MKRNFTFPLLSLSAGSIFAMLTAFTLMASKPDQMKRGDCLLGYQTKLDELLPLVRIQQVYAGDLSKAQLKYRKSETGRAKYDIYLYSWPSDRTAIRQVGGRSVSYPESNQIGLAWVQEINARQPDPVKYFKNMYRTPTEAEKQKAAELIDKKVKDQSPSEQRAGSALEKTLTTTVAYEPVSGVGDAAAWDVPGSQLIVLKGRTTFKIVARVTGSVGGE